MLQKALSAQKSKRESKLLTLLCVAGVAALLLLLVPMLLIAQYDLPLGDDIIYSAPVQQALAQEPTLQSAVDAAGGVVAEKYQSWQGTFSAIFLMALQPGAFGLSYYQITPFLMMAALMLSTLYLLYTLLCTLLHLPKRVWLIIGSILLIFSIQLCSSAREAFYWYNGAVYYTLYHAFLMVLITSIIRLFHATHMGSRIVYAVLGVLLCAVLSGGNYASIMIGGAALCLAAAFAIWKKRYRLLPPLIVMVLIFGAGVAVSILAPGNAVRQAEVLASGVAQSGPIRAIALAIAMGAGFALQWFDGAAIALILLSVLFIGPALRKTGWNFRYPLLVIALAFLVFASQFAPSAYAASSPGPYRLRNVVYFMYLWMILFDAAYLTGWAQRRFEAKTVHDNSDHPSPALRILATYPVAALACAAILIASPLVKTLPPTTPSVIAVMELLNGTAETHAEHRLNQLSGADNLDPDYVESQLLS